MSDLSPLSARSRRPPAAPGLWIHALGSGGDEITHPGPCLAPFAAWLIPQPARRLDAQEGTHISALEMVASRSSGLSCDPSGDGHTPRMTDRRPLLRAIYDAAVAAAHPDVVLALHLRAVPKGCVIVLAASKGAAAMAAAAERVAAYPPLSMC